MSTFYAGLIEIALGGDADGPLLVVIVDNPAHEGAERKVTGSFSFPKTCIPKGSEVIERPATESFPTDLQNLLTEKKPKRLLLVPPFASHHLVPEALRAQYPRLNFEVIALQTALGALPDGATVAAIMPASFFQAESSRSIRSCLFGKYQPKLLITHAHSVPDTKSQARYNLGLQFGLPMHGGFRMNTVVVALGTADRSMRFFKCTDISDAGAHDEVLADLARLLKQGGGETKHGYVIREGLPADAPLVHELYDPTLISKQQSIAAIGEVRLLADLAEIRLGVPLARRPQSPVGTDPAHVARVIEGSDLGPDGRISPDDSGRQVEVRPESLLQNGDLCVGAVSRGRFRIGEVTEDLLPATASNTVIVLRFKPGLASEARQTIFAYLRSAHAAEQLQLRASSLGGAFRLTPHDLAGLPVPILDAELTTEVRRINKSIEELRGWAAEAERRRDTLFVFANPKAEALELKKLGRLSRQRCDAARRVSDQRHRFRTEYPYPIAFRWRTVEACHPDLEGYLSVLGCAEVAVCYLACMSLLLPKLLPEFQVKYAGEIKKRLSESKHGTNMGDWMAIVREVRNAPTPMRQRLEAVPFGEIAALDDETDQALQRLSDARNAQSHEKGPKGSEVRRSFEECKNYLELFLGGIEFVTEYPLLLIERAKRDSILKDTKYQYRKLMGDHWLVPLDDADTRDGELEESLYLADRTKTLHLLRPFMTVVECPECKRQSVFYLDTYSKKEDECLLKSMDHGHTTKADALIVAAFQHVGLLPL